MFNANLFEQGLDFIPDQIDQDANSDVTGDWINLKNVDRAYYVLQKGAGTAGDDISIVLNQATDNAGTSSKALTFSKLWHKVGGAAQWTEVELTTATSDLDTVSVNSTDLGMDDTAGVIIVEVMADSLDINNSFTHVQGFHEGDDLSNACKITTAWLLAGNAYPQAQPASAL